MQRTAPLILVLLAVPGSAQAPPVALDVLPTAEIEIQTFVVQDKASRPIDSDKAVLAIGKKGGIRKQVLLLPGKKSKAKGQENVEVKLVIVPRSASAVSVELELQAVARPAGGKPVATKLRFSLAPGATKLVSLYEHAGFGASIMAMLRADKAEPVVDVKAVGSGPGAQSVRSLRSVTFDVGVQRLQDGEPVFSESQTLNTWMGKPVQYEMAYDVPKEVIGGEDEPGRVSYSTDKARLRVTPIELVGTELKLELRVEGTVYRGSDLDHGFRIDRTTTVMTRSGAPVDVYAVFGQDDIRGLDPAARATASGYAIRVTSRF